MYHIATSAEFESWHNAVKSIIGIPLDGSGKKSYLNGELSDYAPRTFDYTVAYRHPDESDRWGFLYAEYPDDGTYLSDTTQYTEEDMQENGFVFDNSVLNTKSVVILYAQEDGPLVEIDE